jgi:hypothetical protein
MLIYFASGQRYNIIVEAIPDQFTADQSYWIRTTPAPNCTAFNTGNKSTLIPDEHTGVVRYTFNRDIPSSKRQVFPLNCADESYFKDLKPIVHWTVPKVRHGKLNQTKQTLNRACVLTTW